ncbi:YcxB family protein [Lacticaseibacillus suihuaensis]
MELAHVTIAFADYLDYNKYLLRHNTNWLVRLSERVSPYLGVLLLLFAGLFLWNRRYQEAALYAGLGIASLLVGLHLVLKWTAQHEFKRPKNAEMFAPRDMVLDATGITLTTPHGQSHTDWAGYLKVGETQRVFVFLVAHRLAQILPKAGLTPDQIAQLRNLIAANVADTTLMK